MFIVEHLTKRNSEIANKARLLRRQGKKAPRGPGTVKYLFKLIGVQEVAKIHQIRNMIGFVDLS